VLKELPPLSPASFFTFSLSLRKKGTFQALPDLTSLTCEDPFAEVKIKFDEESISFRFEVNAPFKEVSFPKVERGDGIELFLDTRDLKSSKTTTKFCHHFVFLPAAVDEMQGCEVTKFRSDDSHEYPEKELLRPQVSFTKKGYTLEAILTKETLYGYDPQEFPRIGCAYRIHRTQGRAQHFGPPSSEFSLESSPHIWPSIHLRL